jgi:hypothetical protein
MLDYSLFNDGHLSDYAIGLIADGHADGYNGSNLSDSDTYILLTHLEACDKCMDKYINAISNSKLEELPDGLNERIIESIKPEKTNPNKVEIVFINILKLGVGIGLALLLFFSGAFQEMSSATENIIDFISVKNDIQPSESSWNKFTANINYNFSNFVNQWNSLFKGEINHEQ